jgi:hypothetical protein
MSDKPHLARGAIGQFGGRVGHKAAGFISKKFFHPSNYKNQEKLWAAIEAKKEQEKRQEELLQKRQEEQRVEALVKEMEPTERTKRTLIEERMKDAPPTANHAFVQEEQARYETRKRLALLRSSDNDPECRTKSRKQLVSSRFQEDLHENGHKEIWGSFFDTQSRLWGYACCQCLERNVGCPTSDV